MLTAYLLFALRVDWCLCCAWTEKEFIIIVGEGAFSIQNGFGRTAGFDRYIAFSSRNNNNYTYVLVCLLFRFFNSVWIAGWPFCRLYRERAIVYYREKEGCY